MSTTTPRLGPAAERLHRSLTCHDEHIFAQSPLFINRLTNLAARSIISSWFCRPARAGGYGPPAESLLVKSGTAFVGKVAYHTSA